MSRYSTYTTDELQNLLYTLQQTYEKPETLQHPDQKLHLRTHIMLVDFELNYRRRADKADKRRLPGPEKSP